MPSAEHQGWGTGRAQQLQTHSPGLFWGLELKVLCDIEDRLWSILCLITLPAS